MLSFPLTDQAEINLSHDRAIAKTAFYCFDFRTSSDLSVMYSRYFQYGQAFLCCTMSILSGTRSSISIPVMLGNAASHPFMAKSGISYLKIIALFYPFCFTGGSFTGTYNGLGKMILTLIGSTLQISIRVILTWLFFPHFGLAATALATGIGWLLANIFWIICLSRLHRQSLSQA